MDTDQNTTFVLTITNDPYVQILELSFLEELFIKIGKLDKGSFSISKETFTDGSNRINFRYPTDMSADRAKDFFTKFTHTLNEMKLIEIITL